MTIKPTAPANRADLKTWTPAQLEFVAPHWVARLERQKMSDLARMAYTEQGTKAWEDASKWHRQTQEQLTYWKLIADGVKTYKVLPPPLRTFNRSLGNPVGAWDKTLNLWD